MKSFMAVWLIVSAIFFLLIAAHANAADRPNYVFNSAASSVAHKPVRVHCESSDTTWLQMLRAANLPDPDRVEGYTYPDGPAVVYVSPLVCDTLHLLLRFGPASVGPTYSALALLILAHEAVHQRGVHNEALAECLALKEVRGMAVRHFRYPATVKTKRIVQTYRTYTVNGKTVRLKVPVVKTVVVTNPALTKLMEFVRAWHATMPPSYQGGTC